MDDLHIELNILSKDDAQIFSQVFANIPNVSVQHKNITQSSADCIVTAANSRGYMDGGVDGAINNVLSSYSIDEKIDIVVRQMIADKYFGEQPVGTCILVPTKHPKIPWLAHAPTMMMPENVENTTNAYLAFRSVLTEILQFNKKNHNKIKHIVTPSFCTGAGEMSVLRAAKQMKMAYESVANPQYTYNWKTAWKRYQSLLSC